MAQTPTKKPSSLVPDTRNPRRLAKGQTRPQNPWKRTQNIKNHKKQ